MANPTAENENDMVSVLMSVYNTPLEYLEQAVDSILNQTYKNIQFVVVDDCSNNKTVIEYLDMLNTKESRVLLVRNEQNLGLTKSLNVGLARCQGVYIARMDSDDISMPERIQTQVDYLMEHPEVSLAGSNITLFGENKENSQKITDRCDDPEIYVIRSLIQHSGPPHPTFMFRRSFLEDKCIRYREDILKAQDYGIMVDVLKAGGIIRVIDSPLLKYRVHSGQITSSSEIEQMAYQCRISYDYLGNAFPDLSNEERAVISLLGYSNKLSELLDTIRNKEALYKTCSYILDYKESITDPKIYIQALKRILQHNSKTNTYNAHKLEAEFRYKWWKHALRYSRELGKPWGMLPYTLMSYRFVRKYRDN